MARILPKTVHGLSTDGISETQLGWYGTWLNVPNNSTYSGPCSDGAKRQKLSPNVSYQPPTSITGPISKSQPLDSQTPDRTFEARPRLLESLRLVFRHSTRDSINLFLLQTRNPHLQATNLSQAFYQLFEHCRCQEIAQTISACRSTMSSLTFEDMMSLVKCLTLTDDSGLSVMSSPGTRSRSTAFSLVPSEFDTNSSLSDTNTDYLGCASRQSSVTTTSILTNNEDLPATQGKPNAYPMDNHKTQFVLPSQKEFQPQLWSGKWLPQPFQNSPVLNYFQLDRVDKRVYDVPLSDPQSDFSTYCLDLRNSGRRALARGITLNRLTYWGKMDCELLFRDRGPEDDWNVPNWACEVSRRLPHMAPATRMAFAVIFTKVMSYLISPSIDTWQQLPPLLRPTNSQMQNTHDISVAFAPIPKLRDCLVDNPTDWLLVWLKHACGMKWTGVWGDIGRVQLTEVGNWKESALTSLVQTSDSTSVQTLKAVEFDFNTGRRYISRDFQTWCWDSRNWYISKDVLKIWPELLGELPIL